MIILFIKINFLNPCFSIPIKLHESLLSWESTDLKGAMFYARGLTYTLKTLLHKIYKLRRYTFCSLKQLINILNMIFCEMHQIKTI